MEKKCGTKAWRTHAMNEGVSTRDETWSGLQGAECMRIIGAWETKVLHGGRGERT